MRKHAPDGSVGRIGSQCAAETDHATSTADRSRSQRHSAGARRCCFATGCRGARAGEPIMPVKMHQVFYFVALCEEQSFTRAAKRCGVAQPSLTRAIQTLEEEFGAPLFERSRSNVRLTQLGLVIRPDFERISQATAVLAQRITELKATPSSKPEPTSTEASMRTPIWRAL